ncbi:MAG: carboxymuconolactone decarboxylase family protein [Deltaproteobacteria bacterium]|nr:carboxymuconolactone decarboxylase family protein [Deltaproteobacteria bacterium]
MKSYQEITQGISRQMAALRQEVPAVMEGFSALAKAATQDGALDKKTKELIALALAVAAHCDGCIGFHTKTLAQLGAKREEIVEALGMAVYMGGGPSLMYAAEALTALAEWQKTA